MGIIAVSIWIDMIVTNAGGVAFGWLNVVTGIVFAILPSFQTWYNTQDTFVTLYRQARIGTWLIRTILQSIDSSYDLWAYANQPTLLFVYWLTAFPYAILGGIFLLNPFATPITITEQLIIYLLYPTYETAFWEGNW